MMLTLASNPLKHLDIHSFTVTAQALLKFLTLFSPSTCLLVTRDWSRLRLIPLSYKPLLQARMTWQHSRRRQWLLWKQRIPTATRYNPFALHHKIQSTTLLENLCSELCRIWATRLRTPHIGQEETYQLPSMAPCLHLLAVHSHRYIDTRHHTRQGIASSHPRHIIQTAILTRHSAALMDSLPMILNLKSFLSKSLPIPIPFNRSHTNHRLEETLEVMVGTRGQHVVSVIIIEQLVPDRVHKKRHRC